MDSKHDTLERTLSIREQPSSFTVASTLHWTPESRTPASILSKRTLTDDTEIAIPQDVEDLLHVKELDVDARGVVHWREDSITHPRCWPVWRKGYDSAVICLLEFFTTLISNTGSSVARYASDDIGVSNELAIFCFVTLYLFGLAIGGLLFPPIAESFGGRTIYLFGAAGFSISCLIVGASPTLPAVIVGRFFSGFFSAMPTVVAVGSIENMWDAKGRIWVIQIWVMMAIFALALGPPVATYVSESSAGWQWVYYGAAIGNTLLAFMCIYMQESRPALVLRHQVRLIEKATNFKGLSLDDELRVPTVREFIQNNLILPLRLWFTEPLVFLVALMAAVSFGFIYLFAEALHVVYHTNFGLSQKESSLTFLAIGVGALLTWIPRLYDVHLYNMERKTGHAVEPEKKLLGYYIAAPVLAAGLWWFALTVPPLTDNITIWASILSLVLVGYGIVEFDSVLCAYLTDTYTSYAGSANAPVAFLRAVLSGVFPLFAPKKFENLGANNAVFVLAGIATGFCGIALGFRFYAKGIRERSPFAQKTSVVVGKMEVKVHRKIVVTEEV
ncbi:putative major facilitator superfamily, MFS transporter superfamily [Septoria linicola]|nr:putative major facilitator superfamily, MFS transporter superfamily [Septoria linicola]